MDGCLEPPRSCSNRTQAVRFTDKIRLSCVMFDQPPLFIIEPDQISPHSTLSAEPRFPYVAE